MGSPRALALLTISTLLVAAGPAVGGGFHAPSGNIGCYMTAHSARCDILRRVWSPPARPSSCGPRLAWGRAVVVGRSGRAHFICVGDTTIGSGGVLRYGASRSVGRFTCTSRKDGMRCNNRRTGHGFFLSRQGYGLY